MTEIVIGKFQDFYPDADMRMISDALFHAAVILHKRPWWKKLLMLGCSDLAKIKYVMEHWDDF